MGNTRPRKLSDGSLIFPVRGGDPVPPEGYEADPNDPYVMYPKLDDCEDREIILIKRKCCGGNILKWQCQRDNQPTSRLRCKSCVSK